MTNNPSENGPAADQVGKVVVGEGGAEAAGPQSDSELLRALATSVDRNEKAQERFRLAVVRRLARLEARARVLQASDFADPRFVMRGAEAIVACEALISEMGDEIERKMLSEISSKGDEHDEARPRRGRPRKWSGLKI